MTGTGLRVSAMVVVACVWPALAAPAAAQAAGDRGFGRATIGVNFGTETGALVAVGGGVRVAQFDVGIFRKSALRPGEHRFGVIDAHDLRLGHLLPPAVAQDVFEQRSRPAGELEMARAAPSETTGEQAPEHDADPGRAPAHDDDDDLI